MSAERVLNMLGMAMRAGAVIPGTDRVREAARGGTLVLAIIARDASENSRGKLMPLLAVRGIAHVVRYERGELGAAVGRGPLSAVGVIEPTLAARLQAMLHSSDL
jgi:ribosomal protein L7Ae-like RNA K-turn-binding protein